MGKISHYENTPIQIYRKLHLQKLRIFKLKNSDIFHISAQSIAYGYTLEPRVPTLYVFEKEIMYTL